MDISYVTELGEQRPLYHWYTGFPDPREGWLTCDFGGNEMNYQHYDELFCMHGIIEISFDQSPCAYP
eukprot:6056176-Pleurochrysis_carterae.AAC.1